MSIQPFINKEKTLCVVGLGYVGLPVALELARKYKVIGFDINKKRVELMRHGIDPSKELEKQAFEGCDIHFTAEPEEIKQATFFVVAVPTPIDEHKNPNLKPLLSACQIVGSALKQGDVVVFESTVYPGCTEEDCVPVLEGASGLQFGRHFQVGYSPERINPGDKEHTLTKIVKVVSGSDAATLELVAEVYGSIVEAGVYRATSIKVAEASKIIENTQRDLNIALMNELSIIFKKMNINTYEVLEASGTKWNFLKFFPGLVGGHCIGVDPYYLTHKANELGYHSKVILAGRTINDNTHNLIAREIVQYIIEKDMSLMQARVLVMGVTFKENVSDIRNSKVPELIRELQSYKVKVDAVDPYADKEEFLDEYGIELTDAPGSQYDALVVAVNHVQYTSFDSAYIDQLLKESGLLYDVKGVYKGKTGHHHYLSL
jgi:UDP-N-acetyl-D-galactosamine dehydrogenase